MLYMRALRQTCSYFLAREDFCCAVRASSAHHVFYHLYEALNLCPLLAIYLPFLIANNCTSLRGIFEGLSPDGGRFEGLLKLEI
jgi:hypothetical protein